MENNQELSETPQLRTSSSKENYSLAVAVQDSIHHYFASLEDQEPGNLYTMVEKAFEVPLINEVMKYTDNNQSRASRVLAISRGTLRKKLKRYSIKKIGDTQ